MNTTIQPVVDVFPREFAAGAISTMVISVTNGNAASTASLTSADEFSFAFGPPWGLTLSLASNTVTVNSPTARLGAANFALTASATRGVVTVQFTGGSIRFPPGEGFGFAVRFTAPAAASIGTVTAENRARSGHIDSITPKFTTVAFIRKSSDDVGGSDTTKVVGGSVNVTGGTTTVNSGTVVVNSGSTIVAGGAATVTGANTTVIGGNSTIVGGNSSVVNGYINAGSGTTINIGPGAIVNFPAGTFSSAPGAENGPNFLQVAAMKWYEAAGVQRLVLAGNVGAMAFDGRNIWAAIANSKSLVRIEPATGETSMIPLIGAEGVQIPDPVEAMVYDGEKFWMSGSSGGLVVQPDGTVQYYNVTPCAAGSMVFDGAAVWFACGGGLYEIDAKQPGVTTLKNPPNVINFAFGAGFTIAGVAFDGTSLWICGGDWLGKGQLLGFTPGNRQTTIPQALTFAPNAIVFDGSMLWLADPMGTVRRFEYDAPTASWNLKSSHAVGLNPSNLLFDGSNIWVANAGSSNVTKLRAFDGSRVGAYESGLNPGPMVFDGINVWVASRADRTLSRL